jgi:hypothetical protein
MNTYMCISGENVMTHGSLKDVIANVHTLLDGDTSYDSAIRSLTPGTSCAVGATLNVSYITYVMADTLTFELTPVVSPPPIIGTITYTYINEDEDETSYSVSPLTVTSDPPVDLSSVYYGLTVS